MGLEQLARARSVAAGPVPVALWEAVMQGRGQQAHPARELLRHLPESWYDRVRFKPRAQLARGFGTEVEPST